MRLLILSHGHPTLSAGGAERAAYSLFEHMKFRPEISSVFFAARVVEDQIGHDANFSMFRGLPDEILISAPGFDHFNYQTHEYNRLKSLLFDLFRYTRPDIVHIHHFVYFGLEIISIAKSYNAKVVFTLHEYLAICHNYGQMVKTNGRLCHVSSPLECSLCFPDISPGKFFLRKKIVEKFLSLCDVIISPSEFLATRFRDWSAIYTKIEVVENALAPSLLSEGTIYKESDTIREYSALPTSTIGVRIGYFGQLNPFKGISVLLEALNLLPDEISNSMYVGIHGANLEVEQEIFREKVNSLMTKLQSVIHNFGPYDNLSVIRLMREYDWIVVPSVWWENSPVVIQEAKLAGIPLIYSDLGGIAEKSDDKRNIKFDVGNPMSLARGLAKSLSYGKTVKPPLEPMIRTHKEAVERHVDVYKKLVNS